MAKYDVECPSCSTTYRVNLVGPQRDRQYKLDNWDWTCDDCKQKARDEENAKAAAANADAGLPTLTGTEKQIAWAETIRKQKLATLDEEIEKFKGEEADPRYPRLMAAIQKIREQSSARWWIDHRDNYVRFILAEEFKNTETPLPPEEQEAAREAEAEAIAEATVRPEKPVTESVTEIRIKDNSIEAALPEKNEEFRQLVRFKLGYKWTGECWKRTMGIRTGSVQDRAAELGHKLLAAGFPVRIFDEQLRVRAIAGEYAPECHRWIMKRTSGKYDGWFSISWPRDEDFYKSAKRLPGSRYDKPDVVVPSEQFEQILDFAEMYEFALSPGAKELAETARTVKEKALTAQVEEKEESKAPFPGKKPKALDVPENVEVDDEFKEGN